MLTLLPKPSALAPAPGVEKGLIRPQRPKSVSSPEGAGAETRAAVPAPFDAVRAILAASVELGSL